MKHLGLIGKDMPVGDLIGVSDWKSLAPAERAVEVPKMEIYAAMVDRLDWNVGRVLAAFRRRGKLDNTPLIFLSDNGADGGVPTRPARVTAPARPARPPTALHYRADERRVREKGDDR